MDRLVALAAITALSFSPPARAADVEVDRELVLAVDVSRSMDLGEQRLQRDGYVAALQHPEVIQAIQSGAIGKIAVMYFEWAGPTLQVLVAPWTVIGSREDAEDFAAGLAEAPINSGTGTSISSGLLYAAGLLEKNGFTSHRTTIDVSGDGANNAGQPVAPTRDLVVGRGVTVNGLPIVLRPGNAYGAFGIANLDLYYEDCVIGGPGAFMIAVTDMANFAMAIRRKLVTEIAGLPPKVMLAAETVAVPPRVDCLIGEKTRRYPFMDFR